MQKLYPASHTSKGFRHTTVQVSRAEHQSDKTAQKQVATQTATYTQHTEPESAKLVQTRLPDTPL